MVWLVMALLRLEMDGIRAGARPLQSQRKRTGGPCLLGCAATPNRNQPLTIATDTAGRRRCEQQSMLRNMVDSSQLSSGARRAAPPGCHIPRTERSQGIRAPPPLSWRADAATRNLSFFASGENGNGQSSDTPPCGSHPPDGLRCFIEPTWCCCCISSRVGWWTWFGRRRESQNMANIHCPYPPLMYTLTRMHKCKGSP